MKKLLHIIATPRGNQSRTLKVSDVFLDEFKRRCPDCEIDELDLYAQALISLTIKIIDGKYALLGGNDLSAELKQSWEGIVKQIERFLATDVYLISTPMWNFSIPYPLKNYIDVIVQPKYLFKYTAQGPEGLAKNKKMFIITSRGGDYSKESPVHQYDLLEPYLKTVFGFVGITDMTFINAQPMDAMGLEVQREKIKQAQEQAREIVHSF